ncbi:MAG: ShlB/FhaC/HecB family hemolysin secretion/activation protein [Cyanobacteriota bacterium]|nr:ShlB/FhaC/HecB family hemolysin secretion/activation protein [Cyanobacteriota bacterium]
MIFASHFLPSLLLAGCLTLAWSRPTAQAQPLPQLPHDFNPSLPPRDRPPESLPAPDNFLPPSETQPQPNPEDFSFLVEVTEFKFANNTAFTDAELEKQIEVTCRNAETLLPPTAIAENRPCLLSIAQLFQVSADVAQLYEREGYRTSGALTRISPEAQQTGRGTVTIDVIEGELEEIRIIPLVAEEGEPQNSVRLHSNYARSRLSLAATKPLNIPRLQEALQLLQFDPLIERVYATLAEGTTEGKSILTVAIREAPTFKPQLILDNSRAPSIGTFQRGGELREDNLTGRGDSLRVNYTNTDGSDRLDFRYTLPLNPRNGTLSFAYGWTENQVIDPLFAILDINSRARRTEISLRQPILRTLRQQTFQEVSLGLTGSIQESQSFLLDIPFPLSPGANAEGYTKIVALRFFQEWTRQSSRDVIAFRSQFNWGLNILDATINESVPQSDEIIPDSRFFSWQGQAQWIHRFAPEMLFILRANAQIGDRPLVPGEQLPLGGFGSVRGYRQDIFLFDSSVFVSAEFQLPILRISNGEQPEEMTVFHLIPFIDYGIGWNRSGRLAPDPQTNALAAVGLGLQWQQGDRFTARLEWGIPLVPLDLSERTWQENGLYFSIRFGL